MSAEPQSEYLNTVQVAERLGIKAASVRQSLWRGLMPEPDLILMNHPLWLVETIDRWRAKKNKPRKRRRRGVTRKQRIRTVPSTAASLPKNTRLSRDGASSAPLAEATVTAETARVIAAAVRQEGHHCTTRDVQELAQADPHDLDYERQKLQQRVMRKIRALK